jgi:hypothetical protein
MKGNAIEAIEAIDYLLETVGPPGYKDPEFRREFNGTPIPHLTDEPPKIRAEADQNGNPLFVG